MNLISEQAIQTNRYPVYKDSGIDWLGEIPAHWDIKPGFTVINERKEKNIGMKETTVLSLSYGSVIVKPEERLTGLVPESFETYQLVYPDDIIVRPTDLQNDKVSLRVGFAQNKGIITSAYLNFGVNQNNFARYVYYFLHSLDITKVIYGLGSGLRQNLDFTDFKRFPFPLPPLEEQTRIAEFLDRKTAQIDQAIAQKERLIDLLNERRQVLIHRAVTRGLDPNVPIKDSGIEWIGEIPAHWKTSRLKYVTNVQSGLTLGKSYSEKTSISMPYLRVANVQDGYFDLSEIAEINIPKSVARDYYLQKNDILVTEGGDIDKLGRGNVWNEEIKPCLHQNHVFAVRIQRNDILPKFIALLMGCDYGKRYFTTTANKTTNLASTNKTKLGNFPIILPPFEEQEAILLSVEFLSSSIEKIKQRTKQQIQKLQELKATLINSAVTGKIKV